MIMTKTLLNNEEEFQSWKGLNYRHILIENDEEQPSNYPCIVVDKYIEDYYGNDDYLYYTFIYLSDFKK
jgi:hypothetical protein